MRLQEALEASECRGALIEYDDFYTAVEISFCDSWYEIATGLRGYEPSAPQRARDVQEVHRIIQAMDLDLDEWRPMEC